MRVITGQARGLPLLSPSGADIRPTSGRAKEAMFSILQNELGGAAVLDLFAGSGQLGIEALSRGAGSCVFVDADRRAVLLVQENLRRAKLDAAARVVQSDAAAFLRGAQGSFDIVLLDPPYRAGLLESILPQAAAMIRGDGAILCETESAVDLPASAGDMGIARTYRYGKAKLTLYRRESGRG